jgi:hypothetical protein
MSPKGEAGRNGTASAREATRRLDGEIGALREEIGGLVTELDRRRRDIMDVKLQLRRHGLEIALGAAGLAAAAVGVVWLGAWRARRKAPPATRRLRQAVARLADEPDRVATHPSMLARISTAATSAVVVAVIKKGVERWLNSPPAPAGTGREAGGPSRGDGRPTPPAARPAVPTRP